MISVFYQFYAFTNIYISLLSLFVARSSVCPALRLSADAELRVRRFQATLN
jgi:hypothetical protein